MAAATESPPASQQSPPRKYSYGSKDEVHYLKQISYSSRDVQIVLQNKNGPCPLLAICNVLLLRRDLFIDPDFAVIPPNDLVKMVADYMFGLPPPAGTGDVAIFRKNLEDALSLLPSMQDGLDVNVKFTGVGHFEFTSNISIFDLLRINLYHGWVCDPQAKEVYNYIKQLSYNQAIEEAIAALQLADQQVTPEQATKLERGTVIGKWLSETSSQLTVEGLMQLHAQVGEGEISILFRANHFSVITKHNGALYALLTDMGFAKLPAVWERLSETDGDSTLCKSDFTVYVADVNSPPIKKLHTAQTLADMDADYALALQLQNKLSVASEVQAQPHIVKLPQAQPLKSQPQNSQKSAQPRRRSSYPPPQDECILL